MFTSFASSYLSSLFSAIYQLFQINFPGTTVSIFGVFASVMVTVLVINLVRTFTNWSIGLAGRSQKGGNNKKIVVSDSRKGDTR